MGLEYVNRKDDRYYLLQGTTKSGKPKYYCSRKSKGDQVDVMPAGFEWRENPMNGLVSVRRKLVSRILPSEQELVERGVGKLAGLAAIIDLEKDAVVVYTSDQSEEGAERIVEILTRSPALQAKTAWFLRHANHSAMLRFRLHDEEERSFIVDRWCFRGSKDDWIFIAGPGPLPVLIKEYVPHLNEETFFELF